MRLYYLEREQWLPRPIEQVFSFFSRPENLQVLTPPWLDFRMVETPQTLGTGSLMRYRLRWHWLPVRWTTEIVVWEPPNRVVDRQASGPCVLWNHEHRFSPSHGATSMRDCVTYALPLGVMGRLAHSMRVKRDLEHMFDFRAEAMRRMFPAMAQARGQ